MGSTLSKKRRPHHPHLKLWVTRKRGQDSIGYDVLDGGFTPVPSKVIDGFALVMDFRSENDLRHKRIRHGPGVTVVTGLPGTGRAGLSRKRYPA